MAGIYIHIPFCKSRCIYCDFYSTTQLTARTRYVAALCHELELRADYLPKGEPIRTIYIGGGTPSLLTEEHLEQLFLYINKVYGDRMLPPEEMEITLEANPDDMDLKHIRMLHRFPINRISLGIQTFNNDYLYRLHRRHTSAQAERAISQCRGTGFENVSIDLIYGLPRETMEMWKKDLEKAISLHPSHISAYHLTYEEGTPLYDKLKGNRIREVSEKMSTAFFRELREQLLNAGYEHYEISNFALPGKRAKHNSNYWNGTTYIGIGAAAHSYDGVSRQWNMPDLMRYMENIEKDALVFEKEVLSPHERYNDYIVTALRTCEGISLETIQQRWGDEFAQYCRKAAAPYLEERLLVQDQARIHLSPEGIMISDAIMTDLIHEL